MSEQGQTINDHSIGGKIKQTLLGLVGVLVVIPSVINAGADIYSAVMNLPSGDIEATNTKLMQAHWEEPALFKKDIEIKKELVVTTLKLRVYENADIWVKYGKQEQWFASSDEVDISGSHFSLIGNAVAQDGIGFELKNQAFPVLMEELEPVTVDLDKIKSEKEKTLSENNESIERVYLFAETNDSHSGFVPITRKYEKSFQAQDGFVFTDAKLDIISINNSSTPKLEISDDKKTITIEVELESGPFYDRWRGWVKAGVITNQENIQ